MIFNEETTRQLKAKLNGSHVRTREWQGKTLSYIEGWHAISEANRIFGFDAWDRHTTTLKCVSEHRGPERSSAAYLAKVRITVRAGPNKVIREGTGAGYASGVTIAEVHALAAKEAETDATKRALSTFGNPFGLALYDKTQKGVRKPRQAKSPTPKPRLWVIRDPGGTVNGQFSDANACARAIAHTIEQTSTPDDLSAFWKANKKLVGELEQYLGKSKGQRTGNRTSKERRSLSGNGTNLSPGRQQADQELPEGRRDGESLTYSVAGLTAAYKARCAKLWANHTVEPRETALKPHDSDVIAADADGHAGKVPSDADPDPSDAGNRSNTGTAGLAGGAAINKSLRTLPVPKRIRAPEHLKWVASLDCVICQRQPADAHHLKRVQPNAMSRKPGDQWVVPLCRLHHRALHDAGDETKWWEGRNIDPVELAKQLWAQSSDRIINRSIAGQMGSRSQKNEGADQVG